MRDWVSGAAITHLLRGVVAVGGDPDALCEKLAIPAHDTVGSRVAIETMIELWEAAIALTGRRDLASAARTRSFHDECSLLGFVAANQPTVGDGIAVLDRFGSALSDRYCWRIIDDGDRVAVRIDPTGPIDRVGWQAYLELQTFDLVEVGLRAHPEARPLRVSFIHPAPAPIGELGELGGVAPVFSAPHHEVVYPASIRELPIASARPHMAAGLAGDDAHRPVAERARAIVPGLVLARTTEVSDLAHALAMSRRSLERALAAEGASAGGLFEEERHRLALEWLPHHSVEQVARRLGYSSAPAFSRAFRRWTGLPPRVFRRAR